MKKMSENTVHEFNKVQPHSREQHKISPRVPCRLKTMRCSVEQCCYEPHEVLLLLVGCCEPHDEDGLGTTCHTNAPT
jgi:hypothetical protein